MFESSEKYDITTHLVNSSYRYLHSLLQERVVQKIWLCRNPRLLYLGVGTGNSLFAILKDTDICTVCGVDSSEHMLNRADYKAELYGLGTRLNLIHSDIRGLEEYSIRSAFSARSVDVIMTAFTTHHLNKQEISKLYDLVKRIIADRGLFVNIDLFGFNSRHMTRAAIDTELLGIKNRFEMSNRLMGLGLRSDFKDSMRYWVDHYKHDNSYSPLSFHRNILREQGFVNIEAERKSNLNGIITARHYGQ